MLFCGELLFGGAVAYSRAGKRNALLKRQAEEKVEIANIHADLAEEQKRRDGKVREQQMYMKKVEKDNAYTRILRQKQRTPRQLLKTPFTNVSTTKYF